MICCVGSDVGQGDGTGVGDWVGTWFADAARRDGVAAHVRSGGVARIRHFLAADAAAELAAELARSDAWERVSEARPKYQYRFWAIGDHRPAVFFHPRHGRLRQLYGLLNGAAFRRWADALVGDDASAVDAATTVMATDYREGDYAGLHSDAADRRRVAFVLHLAADWDPARGGDLVFVDPVSIVHAEFNALTVFRVGDGRNWHMVTPVTGGPGGAAGGARLAVAGWFNSAGVAAAHAGADESRRVLDVDGR